MSGCQEIKQASGFRGASSATSGEVPSRWSSHRFPLSIHVSQDFDAAEDQAIRDMANAWGDSVAQKMNFMDASFTTPELKSIDLSSYEDGVVGVYKMSVWPEELPLTALAVTQIIGTRKNIGASSEYIEIQHADILINYQMYGFSVDSTWNYDLQTIVLHEMGHLLGLYHENTSVDHSVMFPSITRSVENRYPKPRDISNLESLYGMARSGSARLAFSRHIEEQKTQERSPASEKEERVVLRHELRAFGCDHSFH